MWSQSWAGSHIKAMPAALEVRLIDTEVKAIHDASPFDLLSPMNFVFKFSDEFSHITLD